MNRRSAFSVVAPLVETLETRALLSGEIDHSFGANGLTTLSSQSSVVAVQPDGKIVVAGASPTNSGTAVVVRYLASGAVDTSFANKGTFTLANVHADAINGISVLSGGQILIEGQTYLRLTSAGKLDSKFGGGDGIAGSALASSFRGTGRNVDAVFSDGSFVELAQVPNGSDKLYKYTAAGSVDKTFGTNGYFDIEASLNTGSKSVFQIGGVYRDSSNRLYVSYATGTDAAKRTIHVVRLTSAGKIDTTWGTKGISSADVADYKLGSAIAVTPDGRVLVQAVNTTTHFDDDEAEDFYDPLDKLVVFSNKGVRAADVNLESGGSVFTDSIAVASDGSVYVSGAYVEGIDYRRSEGLRFASVIRLTKDLKIDTTFSADKDGIAGYRSSYYSSGGNHALALSPQGDILLVGAGKVNDELVKFDGPSKATRVTYAVSNGVLTVTGSAKADAIGAFNADPDMNGEDLGYFPGSTEVRLDNDGRLTSADTVATIQGINMTGYANVSKIVANLGDGNDQFSYFNESQSFFDLPVSINGGAGNDTLSGGDNSDTLRGDAGNDVLYGGEVYDEQNSGPVKNNDVLYGGDGNDTLTVDSNYGFNSALFGDAGNDLLINQTVNESEPGTAYFEGGSGTDTAEVNSAANTFSGVEKIIKPS